MTHNGFVFGGEVSTLALYNANNMLLKSHRRMYNCKLTTSCIRMCYRTMSTSLVICSKNKLQSVGVLSYADGRDTYEGVQLFPYWSKCLCQKGVALLSLYSSECAFPY